MKRKAKFAFETLMLSAKKIELFLMPEGQGMPATAGLKFIASDGQQYGLVMKANKKYPGTYTLRWKRK